MTDKMPQWLEVSSTKRDRLSLISGIYSGDIWFPKALTLTPTSLAFPSANTHSFYNNTHRARAKSAKITFLPASGTTSSWVSQNSPRMQTRLDPEAVVCWLLPKNAVVSLTSPSDKSWNIFCLCYVKKYLNRPEMSCHTKTLPEFGSLAPT